MAEKEKDKRVDIGDALGMVETRGLIGMIEAADAMVKTGERSGRFRICREWISSLRASLVRTYRRLAEQLEFAERSPVWSRRCSDFWRIDKPARDGS